MEEILVKIVNECESTKLTQIVSHCHQAIEIICDKSSLLRLPMNEVRDKCFKVFQLCFNNSNKNHKLHSFAINGLQVMIRQQIFWTVNCKEDDQQLPSQLIACISSTIQTQKESTQVDMLSLITEMSCSVPSLISVDNIEDIIEICCKLTPQSTNHEMAIEMTASQSCHQFIKYCLSCDESSNSSDCNTIVDEEIIPLLNLITQKLRDTDTHCNNCVLLKCVQYIFITIPNNSAVINETIVDNIWKVLIPELIKLLSANNMSQLSTKTQETSQQQQSDSKQMGRGSESLSKLDNTNSYKKYIYKIASEILRLFGRISSLRPALESLFHRILLYPPVSQRTDALKYMQEFLKNTSLIVIASSEPFERFGKISRSKDLDLLHIVLDSLEECSLSSDTSIASLSISCIVIFLRSLQSICNRNGLESDIIERINQLYPNLEDAEFEGFDVRTNKIELQSNQCNDKSVDLVVLKQRIIGYDAEHDITDNCEEVVEEKPTQNNELNKNLKNFKVESYRSKLSEILQSRSTDSNTDSQENNSNVKDKDVDKDIDSKQSNKCNDNEIEENNDNLSENNAKNISGKRDSIKLLKMDSISTNYEEVDEYQKSVTNTTTSNTEGPEFEDCVDEELINNDLTDISRKKDDQQWIQENCENSSEKVHQERDNARRFIKALKRFLPTLLSFRSSIETDEALQVFASNYCTELWDQQKDFSTQSKSDNKSASHITIINADGIYLSTYSALLLNLKLIHSNFYSNSNNTFPLTEQEFIDDIHNSGILVYISSYWLAELYQKVLSDNLLANAGYKFESHSNVALINLLTDVDGLDSCQPGAQQLSDYRRLERAGSSHQIYEKLPETEASHKLVRRLLTAFWDSILGCLGTVFRADCNTTELIALNALNILLGNDNKSMNTKKEMITLSLEGLQIAAKLCIQLGLQSRCDTVFELLALSVIQTQSNTTDNAITRKTNQMKRSVIEAIKNKSSFCLHTSHVLSLQVLLTSSLEIGSHCNPCWKYVFKCCQYIMELEHNYFTSRHSSLLTSTRTSFSSLMKLSNRQSDLDLNLAPISEIDMPSMPGINESEDINTETVINNLIAQTTQNNDCILKDKQLERAIDILSHSVDRLFEDAAQKLNLRSLICFLTELCHCSREQLSLLKKMDSNSSTYSGKSLLLFRLSDVILRCAKSGRPLLHFMKCWSVVASHLVETACHSDHSVAKKSISTLHDIINVILSLHNELPHFHFNEALFKPFENLLLLELCDTDVQELIISSICEFVEGTTEEIRSGWRSLFGALRGIRLPPISPLAPNVSELECERVRQLRVILDIFEAFLHTDNLQVFANAAVDCLLCLLRLIKGPPTLTNNPNSDELLDSESPDLCLISLKYLHQFASMLRSMYQMPACPMFSSARRLQSCTDTKLIDTSHLSRSVEFKIDVTLEMLDRPVKILHVWFLLIEQLTQAIETCNKKHKMAAMEMLFDMFKSLIEIPGPNFAIYCSNHILLPSLQRWTRSTLHNESDMSLNNIIDYHSSHSTLRHLCGLTADLVVDNIQLLNYESNGHDLSESTILGINLMLKQSLLVFVECMNGHYNESLAKLSCACIRHILLSVRTHFDTNLWQTTVDCISIAHEITLETITALINAFTNKSPNFFDDLDQIKVITKRDANEDSEQLCRLAQQIFLLDVQKSSVQTINKWEDSSNSSSNLVSIGDNRSFTFLINSSEDNIQLSISYRVLIIQLTCHWLTLQTLSSLLLSGISPLMPHIEKFVGSSHSSKPSILSMDINQYRSLLSLLEHSYRIAFDFDSRPGLKFLIQKISRSEVPSNLYQISSLVWSVQFMTNFYISSDEKLRNTEYREALKQLLTDLCDKYTECVQSSDANDTTIDDICHQSLFFLQATNDELADIIGRDKVIKDNCEESPDNKDTENNLNAVNDENSCNPNNEDDIKIYRLATEKKIDSLMAQYKRFKTQHSPIPPTVTETQVTKVTKKKSLEKKTSNDRQLMGAEKDNEKLIIKDGQAFIALWSEVIASAIELHLSLPINQFNYLIPAFIPSIQTLIIYSNSKQLRTCIALWMSKIADHIIDKLE